MAGLALIVLGFALLVAWFLWAIDTTPVTDDGGES